MTDIRALQERAARAMPPAILDRHGGWWLRYADSTQWWVSSVLPHGDADLPKMIDLAEKFYTSRATRPRFQITPGICPADLDQILAARGYEASGQISLQTAHALSPIATDSHLDDKPTAAWFETWLAVHGCDPQPEREMLSRIQNPSAYASLGTIAVGRAVADTGWAGIFGMATLPSARGKGAARQVLSALARWATDQGAQNLYLQVERDNTAAMRLYERAGFTEVCRYHYRVKAYDE